MKYMVTGTPGTMPIPRELGAGLYQAATQEMEARLADGRWDCAYVFVDTGGFAIANADSHEQVFDDLINYPLFPFFDWEVSALCDWRHSFETIIQTFQSQGG